MIQFDYFSTGLVQPPTSETWYCQNETHPFPLQVGVIIAGHSRLPLHHSIKVIASHYLHHVLAKTLPLPDVLFSWRQKTLLSTSRNQIHRFRKEKSVPLSAWKHPHLSTSFNILALQLGYQPDRNPFTGTFWYSRPGDGCNSRSSKCHSLKQERVRRGGLGYTFHRLENCFSLTRFSFRELPAPLYLLIFGDWEDYFSIFVGHFTLDLLHLSILDDISSILPAAFNIYWKSIQINMTLFRLKEARWHAET